MLELFLAKTLDKSELNQLPHRPGIYYICNKDGDVIYVGRSVNLHQRWNAKGKRRHHKMSVLMRAGTLKYRTMPKWKINHEEAKAIAKYNPPENERNESTNPLIYLVDAIAFVLAVIVVWNVAKVMPIPSPLPPLEAQNVR